jgi:small nuclear ribonucleoprotein B and B'
MKKGSRMMSLIHYRLRVTLNDSRVLIGQMLAYDKHMNLVLAECEEFRIVKIKKKKGGGMVQDAAATIGTLRSTEAEEVEGQQEIKRMLGLVILRGETIVSLSVEGPPPVVDESKAPAVSFFLKERKIRMTERIALTYLFLDSPWSWTWGSRRSGCWISSS